ncbi:MAG: hypothetical protein Q9190_005652 [Brigantiaea leucoxantha]
MAGQDSSLSTLLKRATIEDHEEILQACISKLKQSKKDGTAQHAKVVALLKLERYEDALRVLEESGEAHQNIARLEKAYALYKHGEFQEAQLISQDIANDRGARHIEAQASYRLEDFAGAAKLYKNLISSQTGTDNEDNDLRINGSATDAQLEWQRNGHLVEKKTPGREDLEAFETAYNAACLSIARGEFGRGEILLRRARDLCNAVDDLSEDEKAGELLSIDIQQTYLLDKLGKTEEAQTLLSNFSLQRIPDLPTRLIALNNKIASNFAKSNPYLSHREFASAPKVPKSDKLFAFQAERLLHNESTSRLLSSNSLSATSAHLSKISVLNAAAQAQCQFGKQGVKKLVPLLEKRPHDAGLAMTIAQLYISTNNHGSAAAILEALFKRLDTSNDPVHEAVRHAPGLVATLVSIYSVQGRKAQITTELAKAATYWHHKSKPQPTLYQAAGLALLESPRPEDQISAKEIFSTLYSQEPNSRFATAGYVAAHALSSPASVVKEAESLTSVSRLIADVDVGKLEEAGVPSMISPADAAQTASRKRALDEKPKPAKKRIRKSRLPKDFDANKTPDAERWLPLRERSSYRPKNKKGRQRGAASTQGGVEKGPEKASGEGLIKASSSGQQSKGKKKKGKK